MSRVIAEKRIFFIEEEPYVKQLVKACLKDSGFTVFDFEDPMEAKLLIDEKKPHIILSAIMFQKENGVSFLKDVKSNPEWKNIPFVFYTNLDVQSVQNEAVELGVDGYLLKSVVSPEKVVEEINKRI